MPQVQAEVYIILSKKIRKMLIDLLNLHREMTRPERPEDITELSFVVWTGAKMKTECANFCLKLSLIPAKIQVFLT